MDINIQIAGVQLQLFDFSQTMSTLRDSQLQNLSTENRQLKIKILELERDLQDEKLRNSEQKLQIITLQKKIEQMEVILFDLQQKLMRQKTHELRQKSDQINQQRKKQIYKKFPQTYSPKYRNKQREILEKRVKAWFQNLNQKN